jgi:hypothetical protein
MQKLWDVHSDTIAKLFQGNWVDIALSEQAIITNATD